MEYKCDVCKKEFKNQWRLTNHECLVVKKVDLSAGSVTPEGQGLIRPPVPARIQSVAEPVPVLESPAPVDKNKFSRNWGAEIKAQKPKQLHKYL